MTEEDLDFTLKIKKSTADRLKKVGRKDETYDAVINRLIDNQKKKVAE